MFANTEIRIPIPFFYNIPLGPLSNIPGSFFNVSECDEWYLYQYGPNSTAEDRNYFGENKGLPMRNSKGKGLLSSKYQMY